MEAYTGFAGVYDLFMDNIPYDTWSLYLISLLKEYGVKEGLVADLGCGTGMMTEGLYQAGYDMIGIDNAEEMLEIAREKAYEKEFDILYLQQNMQEMELFGTVAAFVSICDSINYITEENDLLQVFRLVNNYLDPGGIFIFDLNTKYKYETILAQNTFAENRENCSFIWDNYYDSEDKINEYDLTIYAKDEENEGDRDIFYRFDEVHYQKAYELKTIRHLLEKAGMEFVAAYDAFTREAPKAESERLYIIAKEQRQDGKYYKN
ncbi:MAG: class I SAM-dependent methyltransferase [Velocimicrobium sp.]